jgi:hypothetical protein
MTRPTFPAFAGKSVVLALILWLALWAILKLSEYLPMFGGQLLEP